MDLIPLFQLKSQEKLPQSESVMVVMRSEWERSTKWSSMALKMDNTSLLRLPLITSGVSNWGGSALVAALAILSQCPVHSPYVRRGILPDTPVLTKDILNTVEMVMPSMKSSFCVPN